MKPDPTRTNQLVRWRDRGADAHALESRAALLVDAAAGEPAIDQGALKKIHAAVSSRRRLDRAPGLRGRGLAIRLALAGVLVVASIATARGAVFLWRRHVAPAPLATPAGATSGARTSSGRRRVATETRTAATLAEPARAPVAPLADEPPPAAGASAPTPPVIHSPRVIGLSGKPPMSPSREVHAGAPAARAAEAARSETPASSPVAPEALSVARRFDEGSPEAAAPSSTPPFETTAPAHGAPAVPVTAPPKFAAVNDTEAHLLAQALAQIRQAKDPRASLATLARYTRLFPHGVLENEALRTRVEATMALPDPRAALALLDAKESFRGSLGADLLIARAELRANAGRCADALGDFAQVLAAASARDVEERALFGEAVCLLRAGQRERAQGDLAAYRRRFPHGRFASEVERLLSGSAGMRSP